MKKESEVKERLYHLAKQLGLNPSQFSAKIGKDRTYLSNISREVQTDVLRNIYISFPQVNIIWIITGEGKMLLESLDESMVDINPSMLLTMFKDKDKAYNALRDEKDALIEQNHQLEKEVQSLKIALGIEEIPKSKVG